MKPERGYIQAARRNRLRTGMKKRFAGLVSAVSVSDHRLVHQFVQCFAYGRICEDEISTQEGKGFDLGEDSQFSRQIAQKFPVDVGNAWQVRWFFRTASGTLQCLLYGNGYFRIG